MVKILVVDDEKNICELYKGELGECGYDVSTANSSETALELLKNEKFDLVILDIRMPGMDGIEALGRILNKNDKIPVIINSAYEVYKDDFRSWLAVDYIIKSNDLTELKDKVAEVLKKRGLA